MVQCFYQSHNGVKTIVVTIGEFQPADIEQMIYIWNGIAEGRIAFSQTERLNEQNGIEFFGARPIAVLPKVLKRSKLWDCTYSTRIA